MIWYHNALIFTLPTPKSFLLYSNGSQPMEQKHESGKHSIPIAHTSLGLSAPAAAPMEDGVLYV